MATSVDTNGGRRGTVCLVSFQGLVNGLAPPKRPRPGTEGTSFDAKPTLPQPRFTFREWLAMMRDTSYQRTSLGPEVVRYLAWKRMSRASERTLDQYERDLRLVCVAVPATAATVTHSDLILVLDRVPEKSWRRVRAAWSDFFKWAVMEGIRPDNPVDRLPRLRPTAPPIHDLWTQPELDLLVAATRRMEAPLRERLRVLTMIESGGRKGEMLALQLADFDLYRKVVRLQGKGGKERLVPVSAELCAVVDEYLLTPYPMPLGCQPRLSDHVWYGVWRVGERVIALKPERPLSSRGFHEWWVRVETAAGVRHRKPHMTRHTFATDVLDATEGDLYALKELLGHSSTKVTEDYLHNSRLRTRAATDKLAIYRHGH